MDLRAGMDAALEGARFDSDVAILVDDVLSLRLADDAGRDVVRVRAVASARELGAEERHEDAVEQEEAEQGGQGASVSAHLR